MKSVIPFTKELDFNAKVNEITSISLEREFEVEEGSVVGNLFVSGEYKSHEISVNVVPFSFKIPFTIEIPDNLDKDSITIEISDFAYDMVDDSKIKVNIELELEGEEVLEEEVEEEENEKPTPEVNTEEILEMFEDRNDEEENKDTPSQEDVADLPREEEQIVLTNTNDVADEYTTYHIHIIKEGESVETICTMYNTTMDMLMDYNDLSNLAAGEKLVIPSTDE